MEEEERWSTSQNPVFLNTHLLTSPPDVVTVCLRLRSPCGPFPPEGTPRRLQNRHGGVPEGERSQGRRGRRLGGLTEKQKKEKLKCI